MWWCEDLNHDIIHSDIYIKEEAEKEPLLNICIISEMHFDQIAESFQMFTGKKKVKNLD